MNKKELIEAIREHLNEQHGGDISAASLAMVLDSQAAVVRQALAIQAFANDGEGELTLPGLGKLKTGLRAARMGRNPQNGEVVEIPARVTVKLRPSAGLNAAINGEVA